MRFLKQSACFRMSAVALMAVATAVQPASADDSATFTQVVSVQGLDLSTPADQAILRHRLKVAAWKVCSQADADGASDADGSLDECREAAFRSAWSQAGVLIASAKSRSMFAAGAAPSGSQPQKVVASLGTQGQRPRQ